jgi:lysine 2,3-aminomutase
MKAQETLRTPSELVDAGLASRDQLARLEQVAARYAVAITPALRALIEEGGDPIARQFVPDAAELLRAPNERADPIGDDVHSPVPGIVHRYPDRVLLKITDVCAAYCRFCFRRMRVGKGAAVLSKRALESALAYIRDNREIWEVILTGGDPFVLSPRRLEAIAGELAAVPHVKILRVHTRVPIAAPHRVTPALIRALKTSGKTVYVALHVNHARELTAEAKRAAARIVDAGIPMLAQTVLLAGVNDDAAVLAELMRALVEARIKPYYLHHADPAPGTARFRTKIARGQELIRGLHGRNSGLCQPAYVLDIPGGYGKSPIGPGYLFPQDGAYQVEDFTGRRHCYRES